MTQLAFRTLRTREIVTLSGHKIMVELHYHNKNSAEQFWELYLNGIMPSEEDTILARSHRTA